MKPPPPPMASTAFSTAPLTTEQIQKLLDENKQLIMLILENQSQGKLAECAQYQALLQKNLMYLAAIADAQPQAVISQTLMQPALQQGPLIQHPQYAINQQQFNMLASNVPQQVNSYMHLIHPQLQRQQLQQQQSFLAQAGIRPCIQIQQLEPNSFTNSLSRQIYSGAPGSGITQGKQSGTDKQS